MSDFEFIETTTTSSENSDSEELQGKKDIKKAKKFCNLYKCNFCHPNRPKLTEQEIKEIKDKIKKVQETLKHVATDVPNASI